VSFFLDREHYDLFDALALAVLLAIVADVASSVGWGAVVFLVFVIITAVFLGQKITLVRMRRLRERKDREP
jgi:hypothetical protein